MSTSEGQHRWDGLERNTRGKTEVVWTCMEEILWLYLEKYTEDGVARKEETGKAKNEVCGCRERGHRSG